MESGHGVVVNSRGGTGKLDQKQVTRLKTGGPHNQIRCQDALQASQSCLTGENDALGLPGMQHGLQSASATLYGGLLGGEDAEFEAFHDGIGQQLFTGAVHELLCLFT